MELKKAERSDLSLIRALYEVSFPRAERKPFSRILRNCRQGRMILLTIQEESGFAGFFVLAVCQDLMLVDYFAVAAGKRDRGIGSQALGLLRRRCPGKKIFLEIETEDASAENAAQRKKRKLFYLRNGMKETGICWRLFGVEMEILSFSDLSREESARMYAFLYGRFWFLPIRPV